MMPKQIKQPWVCWFIKVVLGLLLILHFVFVQVIGAGEKYLILQLFTDAPVSIAQALVCLGGISVLYHYHLLRYQIREHGFDSLQRSRGLFAYVRHPMYSSDLVMYSGFFLFAPNMLSLMFYVGALVAIYLQALAEDEYMAFTHGEIHRDWVRQTGLLFPNKVFGSIS